MTEQPDKPETKEESQQSSNETPEQPNEPDFNDNNQKNKLAPIIKLQQIQKDYNFQQKLSNKKELELSDQNSSPKTYFKVEDLDLSSQSSNLHRSKPEQWLQKELKKINKDIGILDEEDDHLTNEISDINEELRYLSYGDQKRRINKNLKAAQKKRNEGRQQLEELHNLKNEIEKELESRKKNGNESAEHINSVSVQSLFLEDEPIENTVLYVATFFTDLSISDFKRVVAKCLGARTVSITKSQTIIEDGKSNTIQTQEEQSLVKKWEKSFQEAHQADKTLKNCYLKVIGKEDSLVVDFSSPDLRTKFIQYFRKEQAFYIEEQYKHVQELLFDVSEHVANSAIYLLGEAATYYPNDYGVDWLLRITSTAEDINSVLLFARVSKLIFEMQIILEPVQSERIIKRFLDVLLEREKNYVFGISFYLIYRQLYSNSPSKINSLKHLLDWLKQVLDKGNKEQKAEAYSVLETLLAQKNSHEYIYDILRILKAWLPESERATEKYSSSNQTAILLLVSYCGETINTIPTEKYGIWPSEYPLFTSMHNDSDVDSSLNLLVSWLFHPSANQGLAINYVFPDEMDAIGFIGFMIAQWFTILYGLQEDKPEPEASKLAKSLLEQIVIVAERSKQKRLTEFWASLAEVYLKEAANYAQSNADKQLKREFVCRRKLVKELINSFKALQHNNKF